MSWDNSRRKPGRPSSPDSTRDALYDRLLSQFRQGPEPPATPDEYRRWIDELWRATHPGEFVPLLDARLPSPIGRRQALDVLMAFNSPDEWARLRLIAHEDTHDDDGCGCAGLRMPCAVAVDLGAEYAMWRRALIERYRLEGLVSPAS